MGLDFLRRLGAQTLDEISKQSYFVRNEKAVDNPAHCWQTYFAEIWKLFTPLPTATHRYEYKIHLRLEYFETPEEIGQIATRADGVPALVRMTETVEYRLVSASATRESEYVVQTTDRLTLPERVETVLRDGCLLYCLEIDGSPADLSKAVRRQRTSPEVVKGTLQYRLKYRASALVKMIRKTIEPAAGAFYSFSTGGPARDLDVSFSWQSFLATRQRLTFKPTVRRRCSSSSLAGSIRMRVSLSCPWYDLWPVPPPSPWREKAAQQPHEADERALARWRRARSLSAVR